MSDEKDGAGKWVSVGKDSLTGSGLSPIERMSLSKEICARFPGRQKYDDLLHEIMRNWSLSEEEALRVIEQLNGLKN